MLYFINLLILLTPLLNPSTKMIKVQGQVINAETQTPVTANVSITYQTLPHGSDYGILKIKNGNGMFDSYLRKDFIYRVQAKAPGFAATSKLLDKMDQRDKIILKLNLIPARKGEILKLNRLIFNQGDHHITKDSEMELEDLFATLAINPSMVIQLEGHTDVLGQEKLNKDLSQKRVESVKGYLINKGIKSTRIKLRSFGEEKPLVARGDAEQRKVNRRVEVRILEL